MPECEFETTDLTEMLEKLEEFANNRNVHAGFVLVEPRKGECIYVRNYVWVGRTKPKYVCQKWIGNGSELAVAARNYTLSKYTVRFSVSADGSAVKLRKDPTSECMVTYSDQLYVPPQPPHLSPGTGVSRACEILVESNMDPTATLNFTRDILNELSHPWRGQHTPGSIVVEIGERH